MTLPLDDWFLFGIPQNIRREGGTRESLLLTLRMERKLFRDYPEDMAKDRVFWSDLGYKGKRRKAWHAWPEIGLWRPTDEVPFCEFWWMRANEPKVAH